MQMDSILSAFDKIGVRTLEPGAQIHPKTDLQQLLGYGTIYKT